MDNPNRDWPSCLAVSSFTVEIKEPCCARTVGDTLKQVQFDQRPFFFLDEVFLAESEHTFIRDVLRVCGVVPILMSSDSGVANLVNSLVNRQTRERLKPYNYCFLLTNTAPCIPEILFPDFGDLMTYLEGKSVALCSFVKFAVANGRPLFARWALEALWEAKQREATTPQTVVQLLDTVASSIANNALHTKRFNKTHHGRCAQVNLFSPDAVAHIEDMLRAEAVAINKQAASLQANPTHPNREKLARELLEKLQPLFEFPQKFPNTEKMLEFITSATGILEAPFLSCHFARLLLSSAAGRQDGCMLQYYQSCLVYPDSSHTDFKAHSRFPNPKSEPLFFLSLVGTVSTAVFFGSNGQSCSARTAFYDVVHAASLFSGVLTKNTNAEHCDGDYLEQLVTASAGAASHFCGLSGTPVDEFVGLLASHLFPNSGGASAPGSLQLPRAYAPWPPTSLSKPLHHFCRALKGKTVGFLPPANCKWPKVLRALAPDVHLSNLCRPPNPAKCDVQIDDWLVLECKNRRGPLPLQDFKEALLRVKHTTLLHVVVCQKLQQTYFSQSASSFEDLAAQPQHSHLASSLVMHCSLVKHRVVFSRIEGTPDTADATNLVLFFAVGDCEKSP
eukprot:TRINITY_DN97_c0_g2_i3.p1 TRINITY_DN97_c0_g2~~TRINITY_DN97_c0_g2_i3.p1  ORF type:complete len:713 (-),score=113.73 TRINITY_DN97_c0_g2_i3:759-2612(-)